MSQDLPMTSYALLGLLSLGDPLSGYELKQRADRTLRYYWTSPAMSQVYSELARLHRHGLVRKHGRGRTTTYEVTAEGSAELQRWLAAGEPGFPVLKHPVALRLMLGALAGREAVEAMLHEHHAAAIAERESLEEVRGSLRGNDQPGQPFRYPALVAEWGLAYLDNEARIVTDLLARLEEERP